MPPGVVEVIGGGTTSFVGLLDDGNILKYPIVKGESVKEFEVEAAIYEALGKHPRIIGYLGQTRHGIKLERGSRLTEHLDDGKDLSLKTAVGATIRGGVTLPTLPRGTPLRPSPRQLTIR